MNRKPIRYSARRVTSVALIAGALSLAAPTIASATVQTNGISGGGHAVQVNGISGSGHAVQVNGIQGTGHAAQPNGIEGTGGIQGSGK